MASLTPAFRLTGYWRALLRVLLAGALLIGLVGPTLKSEAAPTATTWHVAVTGNDANDCQTPATACRNIKRAIDKATSGDTILIGEGTFAENLNIFKSLTLQGAGADVTFIDGNSLATTAIIAGAGENIVVTLMDLTVQNGRSSGDYGGGLLISGGAVNLSNVIISNNVAPTGGGGIFSLGSLTLNNVSLIDNVSEGDQRGGGLYNLGTATLTDVTVAGNSANLGGGIGNAGVLTLTTSAISNNRASDGAGIYNVGSGARFVSINNTYIGNQATGAGGAIYNATLTIDTGSLITASLAATSGGGIYNTSAGQLILNGTTLRNNQATSTFGGGLSNGGLVTLTAVIVRGNTAAGGNGGGIYSFGTYGSLSLVDTLVADNRAVNGGGIYAASISGTLTLVNSQVTNNQSDVHGGGLYSNIAANLTAATVSNNHADSGSGGGIYHAAGQLSIARGTLANNQALTGSGGGLFNGATATLNDATLQHNQSDNGGGLYNSSSGRLNAANSTWYLNSAAQRGGGLYNQGALTLTQSTLYSNTTTSQGGSGLYNANAASAQLTNVTLSYNTALGSTTGAIRNDGGALNVLNSTISDNAAPALTGGGIALANTLVALSLGGDNCAAAVTSTGYNLSSDSSCGLSATGDISNTDPLLGPLSNNGGATLTRSLLPNSPALDAGNDANCPSVDQRGIARPQGDHCDIGAYEIIGFNNSVTATVGAGGCLTSTTSISQTDLIGTLHVGVNLTFEPRGELRVNLYSPDNSPIQLLGATGGAGQNLDVLWDDDALLPVGVENHSIEAPFYKYVRAPDQSLTPLFDRSLRGDWRLEICNLSSGVTNTATLNRWSLEVPSFGSPKVYLPIVLNRWPLAPSFDLYLPIVQR